MQIPKMSPRLVARACGGWLAVTEDSSPLRIGVTGATEAEASRRFAEAVERWRAILEEGSAASEAEAERVS